MKLISLACRHTSNVDHIEGQVIEVAAVIFDPDPKIVNEDGSRVPEEDRRWKMFEALLAPYDGQHKGTARGFSRCSEQIAEVAGDKRTHIDIYFSDSSLSNAFRTFIGPDREELTPMGVDIRTTLNRLDRLDCWPDLGVSLDPSSLLFVPDRGHMPDLDECMEILGLRHEGDPVVSRRSLQEAQDAASVVSRFLT